MQEHKKSFDIRLRDKKRELQKIQARAIERKDLRLKKMQALVCEKRTMIAELTQDTKANSRRTTKLLKLSMSIRDKTIERARQRDEKAKWWKREYEDLVKQLHVASTPCVHLIYRKREDIFHVRYTWQGVYDEDYSIYTHLFSSLHSFQYS